MKLAVTDGLLFVVKINSARCRPVAFAVVLNVRGAIAKLNVLRLSEVEVLPAQSVPEQLNPVKVLLFELPARMTVASAVLPPDNMPAAMAANIVNVRSPRPPRMI